MAKFIISTNQQINKLQYFKIILLSFLFITACEKNSIFPLSKEKILISHTWRMKSFINVVSNTSFDVLLTKYQFEKDNKLTVIPQSYEPQYSTWKLEDDGEYLTIGSNMYKVKIITNKLLGLRFGDIDIFYVPIDK